MSDTQELVVAAEQQARLMFLRTLEQIAEFFPVTERDMELVSFGQSLNHTRRVKGQGRQQITVARCMDGTLRHGTQTEAEELEARSDPDAQFTSSWVDALQHANDEGNNPLRVTEVVTQRWIDGSDNLTIVPPDSVGRMQYIQFSPGVNYLCTLKGRLVKLPAEVMYPWDFCPRPLPTALEQQRPDWPYHAEVADLLKGMIIQIGQLFPPTEGDSVLIDMARLKIRQRFAYGFWQLASAFVTNVPGHYHVGFQSDTKSGRANTDAEQSAIKKARRHYPGERIQTIVTAHHSTKNHSHDSGEAGDRISLVMSCALCRKSLLRHNPDMMVIVPLNGHGIGKVPIWTLYPLPDFAVPALDQAV